MKELLGNIFVAVSAVLWAIELIPQIIKTLKRKTVDDISFWWPSLCFTAYIIYEIAMVLHKNWWYFGTHMIPGLLTVLFIGLMLKYRSPRGKRNYQKETQQ